MQNWQNKPTISNVLPFHNEWKRLIGPGLSLWAIRPTICDHVKMLFIIVKAGLNSTKNHFVDISKRPERKFVQFCRQY